MIFVGLRRNYYNIVRNIWTLKLLELFEFVFVIDFKVVGSLKGFIDLLEYVF